MVSELHLLYGADGNTCSTGDYEMAVLDVWSDLIQDEGDDMRLHCQKQHVAPVNRFFVACGQIHPHFLKGKKQT